MKITDQQLGRFLDMVRDFSMRNGLTAEVETGLGMETSTVRLYSWKREKSYRVVWKEVRSLTEAGARIFADAMNVFGLIKSESSISAFDISNVIFNNPATIVLWDDGTKTVVKCQEGDEYSEEVGLALCFAKKALGNKPNFNNVFKKWIPEETPNAIDDSELRKSLANAVSASSIAAGVMEKFREAMQQKRKADNWLDNI